MHNPRKSFRYKGTYLLVYSLFVLFVVLSWFLNRELVGSSLKLQKLLVFNTSALIGGILLSSDRVRLLRFVVFVEIYAGVMAFATILTEPVTRLPRTFIGVFGSNYQSLGIVESQGVIISLVALLFIKRNFLIKSLLVGYTVLLMIVLLLSAHLNPIIGAPFALIFSLSIWGVKRGRTFSHQAVKWLIAIVLVVILVLMLSKWITPTFFIRRLGALETGDRAAMVYERLFLYHLAYRLWLQNPIFGNGWDTYHLYSGVAGFRHPHNIFLEMLAELGIVGLLMMIYLIVSPFLSMVRSFIISDGLWIIYMSLFVHSLIIAQTGGDITDNRLLFAFMGCLIAYRSLSIETSENLVVRL